MISWMSKIDGTITLFALIGKEIPLGPFGEWHSPD